MLPNRSLVVCCDQEEILKKWVDAINSHIQYERKTEHLKKIQMCAAPQPIHPATTATTSAKSIEKRRTMIFGTSPGLIPIACGSEAQMVEEEMSQQMCFTIMHSVLRRWVSVESQARHLNRSIDSQSEILTCRVTWVACLDAMAAQYDVGEVRLWSRERPRFHTTSQAVRGEFPGSTPNT